MIYFDLSNYTVNDSWKYSEDYCEESGAILLLELKVKTNSRKIKEEKLEKKEISSL